MGQRVVKFCDLDESHEATENVALALNGSAVELDLCKADAETVVETVKGLMKPGRFLNVRDLVRRPFATTVGESGPSEPVIDTDPATIRTWAASKGIPVNDKGRIPQTVEAQYLAEQKAAADEAEKVQAAKADTK